MNKIPKDLEKNNPRRFEISKKLSGFYYLN